MSTPVLAGWAVSSWDVPSRMYGLLRAQACVYACKHGEDGRPCANCLSALADGTVGDYTPTDARPEYTTHDDEGIAMARAYGRRRLPEHAYPSESGLYAWDAYPGPVIPVYRKAGKSGLYVTPPIANPVELAVRPTIAAGWHRYELQSGHTVQGVKLEANGSLVFDVVHARPTAWHNEESVRRCYGVIRWSGRDWRAAQHDLVKVMNQASEAVSSSWVRAPLRPQG